ncbi:rCG57560, partial [Rattus norvegicus]
MKSLCFIENGGLTTWVSIQKT